MSREMGACFQRLGMFLKKKLEADKTQHFINLAPPEKMKFEKALQAVNDKWIKERRTAKNLRGVLQDIGK